MNPRSKTPKDPLTGEATYHTDFHPSNVLYEPQSDTLTFIDLDGCLNCS